MLFPTKHTSAQAASAEQFMHEPLDLSSKTIRVFRILRVPKNSILKCELKVISLNESHQGDYVCLSYVWGPPDKGYPILVNGSVLCARKSLYEFFLTARRMKIREWLWVDAISIDQNNVVERNHQVREMAEIYQSAQYVLVWPGLSAIRVRRVEIASKLRLHTLSVRGKEVTNLITLSSWLCRLIIHWIDRDIFNISQLEYFTRVWIIQEFLLAKEIFSVFQGHKIPVDKLLPIYHSGWCSAEDIGIYALLRFLALRGPERRSTTFQGYQDLLIPLNILFNLRRSPAPQADCADIRDRVFGIVGLLHPSVRPPIRYDLHRSTLIFHLMLHYSSSHPKQLEPLFELLGSVLELKIATLCLHTLDKYGFGSITLPVNRKSDRNPVYILLCVLDGDARYIGQQVYDKCDLCSRWHEHSMDNIVLFTQPTPQ